MRVIDLSLPLVDGQTVDVTVPPDLPVYLGHECCAWDLAIRSHTGTYVETASHVFRDGRHVSDVPPEDLVLPCALVTLDETAAGGITGAELQAAGDPVRRGDALIVATPKRDRYFERDAVTWMIDRGIKLLGATLDRYDTGFENPTGMFVDLFKAEIPIVAGLTRVERLSRHRFELIVAPLPVQDVGTVPARVLAIER